MANDRSGPPHYENTYNPQPPVEPGNVPYADFFRAICPGAQRPRNPRFRNEAVSSTNRSGGAGHDGRPPPWWISTKGFSASNILMISQYPLACSTVRLWRHRSQSCSSWTKESRAECTGGPIGGVAGIRHLTVAVEDVHGTIERSWSRAEPMPVFEQEPASWSPSWRMARQERRRVDQLPIHLTSWRWASGGWRPRHRGPSDRRR
jgi:hypothetical protein